MLALLLLFTPNAFAQNCGAGLGADLGIANRTFHVGDTLTLDFVEVFSSANTCTITNGRLWLVYPDNSVALWLDSFELLPNSAILCPGNPNCPTTAPLTYVIKPEDVSRDISFETNFPSDYFFGCGNSGHPKSIQLLLAVAGDSATDPTSIVSACQTFGFKVVNARIDCTCASIGATGENGAITFTGTVTNTGDVHLRDVSISNLVNGTLTLVTNFGTLAPGEAEVFSGSFIPVNACNSTTNTIYVTGNDNFGKTVTSQFSTMASNILQACILVLSDCPTPTASPGQTVTFTGFVTNCGNMTISNLTLLASVSGAQIGHFDSLPPGGSVPFETTNSLARAHCGDVITNMLLASGIAICGQPVTNVTTCTFMVTCLPAFTNLIISASDLVLSGSGGASNQSYIVLTATNALNPNWIPLVTNTFTADGLFMFTNEIDPAEPQRYFRLLLAP